MFGPTPKYERVEAYIRPDDRLISIAGPCSIESREQIDAVIPVLIRNGVRFMRGGVFRAGTYPPDNFGLIDEELIEYFSLRANDSGMECVLEVLDYSEPVFNVYADLADVLQIGARQMQNYTLLKKVAEVGKPVFLKRNMGATLNEWLGAAEYLLKYGCNDLTLIERGSSTFHQHVRWDLSISMIPSAKAITDIPVVVDASHGTGRRELVAPMTLAGIAAGADGFLVEVHPEPDMSLSDAQQALGFAEFTALVDDVKKMRRIYKDD